MKKLFAALVLSAAAVTAAVPAAAAAPAPTSPMAPTAPGSPVMNFVTAKQCADAGGKVVPGLSMTGQVCQGGKSDGAWVIPDFQAG